MKVRPSSDWSAVPDNNGTPLLVANTESSYRKYLEWLASYLYRPKDVAAGEATLSLEQAWALVSPIESEIAFWIWEHPFEDYPPDSEQPRHADILHRPELSAILSRVLLHEDRAELLHRFYRELNVDSSK